MMKISRIKQVLPLIFLTLLGACQNVQPWERGTLAKSEMQLDPQMLDAQLRAQVYFSKEASSGSNKATGGGCGCN